MSVVACRVYVATERRFSCRRRNAAAAPDCVESVHQRRLQRCRQFIIQHARHVPLCNVLRSAEAVALQVILPEMFLMYTPAARCGALRHEYANARRCSTALAARQVVVPQRKAARHEAWCAASRVMVIMRASIASPALRERQMPAANARAR